MCCLPFLINKYKDEEKKCPSCDAIVEEKPFIL
jgi:hypothetical protein